MVPEPGHGAWQQSGKHQGASTSTHPKASSLKMEAPCLCLLLFLLPPPSPLPLPLLVNLIFPAHYQEEGAASTRCGTEYIQARYRAYLPAYLNVYQPT